MKLPLITSHRISLSLTLSLGLLFTNAVFNVQEGLAELPRYRLKVLDNSFHVRKINNSGKVLGVLRNGYGQPYLPAIYDINRLISPISMVQLPSGVDPNRVDAVDINSSGQISGFAEGYDEGIPGYGLFWSSAGAVPSSMTAESYMGDINNAGAMLGIRYQNGYHQILVTNSGQNEIRLTDLGFPANTSAKAINDLSIIAGAELTFQPTRERLMTFNVATGAINYSSELASSLQLGSIHFSNAGVVVGDLYDRSTDEEPTLAYRWDGTGDIRIIAGLSGSDSNRAESINNQSIAVGTSCAGSFGCRGVIWSADGNTVTDLNSRIVLAGGWQVNEALDINDRGEIIGRASRIDGQRSVVLIPILSTGGGSGGGGGGDGLAEASLTPDLLQPM